MKVDFSAVTGPEPRKAGEYTGLLVNHSFNPASKSSGQPTMTLEWTEQDSNRKMFKTYSLQPNSLWSLKRDLIRIGASMEDMSSPTADLDKIVTGLYGYASTIVYGDPRPDKNDPNRLYDNFLEVKDPTKE